MQFTKLHISLQYLRMHKKASTVRSRNSRKGVASMLPPSSRYISSLSLKAAVSKPMLPPGDVPNRKPKSMCTKLPLLSIIRLPLWRSFTARM